MIGSYRIIFKYADIEHHTMKYILTIIMESKGEYFYLQDEKDKIDDVLKMPEYIKEDWIKYNKKDINLKILDYYIKEFHKIETDESNKIVGELFTIRRDLLIRKIV
jgi:hypothetical protein